MKKVLVTGVYSLIGNVIYRRLVAARIDDGAPATTFTVSHGGGVDLGFDSSTVSRTTPTTGSTSTTPAMLSATSLRTVQKPHSIDQRENVLTCQRSNDLRSQP
jgi:hypothetical protein